MMRGTVAGIFSEQSSNGASEMKRSDNVPNHMSQLLLRSLILYDEKEKGEKNSKIQYQLDKNEKILAIMIASRFRTNFSSESPFAGAFKREGANVPANESRSLLPSARIAA